MTICSHRNVVNVENWLLGIVAKLCTDCYEQLSPSFQPPTEQYDRYDTKGMVYGGIISYWTEEAKPW